MKFTSLVRNTGMAFVVAGCIFTAEAGEDVITTVSASNVVFLQEAYLVSRVQSELNRFNASMIKIRFTDNRDMFLINRDELWNSREELSFALASMLEYKASPFRADDNDLADSVRNLLTESEGYANEQNLLISSRAKSEEGYQELMGVILDLKKQEQVLIGSITPAQQVAFEDMTISRDILENMFATFFATDDITELQGIAKQIEGSINDYSAKLSKVATDYPELSDNLTKFKRLTKDFFDEKNIGGSYFVFKQKLEAQRQLEAMFDRKFKVITRDLNKFNSKLRMRIGF